jgi:hypothetical protein
VRIKQQFYFTNVCTWFTTYTVKPANADTSIKQSSVLKGNPFLVIENFIWIKPLLRGCLSYKAIKLLFNAIFNCYCIIFFIFLFCLDSYYLYIYFFLLLTICKSRDQFFISKKDFLWIFTYIFNFILVPHIIFFWYKKLVPWLAYS